VRADIAFAVLDVFVVVAAYTLGLALRMLDPLVGEAAEFWSDLAMAMPVIVVVHLLANIAAGGYGHVWEHASTSEAVRVVIANVGAGVLLVAGNLWARHTDLLLIPWSVPVVGGLVSLFAMGMVRFRSRLFSFHKSTGAVRLLVVGTGIDAVAFARQAPRLDGGRRVVGFLSDEEPGAKATRRLAGLQILGSLAEIADIVERHQVDEVVVVGGESTRTRQVVDLCLSVDVRLRMLPSAVDVLRHGVAAVDVRDIEVADLLVRQRVHTDLTSVGDLLLGKRVLVTGAGGSIGSEIVKQVLEFDPGGVWALDRDETLLHDARLRWPGQTHTLLGDIRDAERMLRVFEGIRPQIVFHAAALKHVPMLEDHPEEAVLTNVIGTRNVIEAGSRTGMERFVLISTDKAVSPSSVMGATKRTAEIITQAGAIRGDGCVYTAVRFGNVLGSRGSVIPTFIHQIKSGGPVTVTDPAMMRYFMTVDEAVQLVLQASALATGREVFLLDMGEPVRIEDLARRLIRLSGMSPERDIEIRFVGRRPGEKLAEMLALDPLRTTKHEKIFEVSLDYPGAGMLMNAIAELEEAAVGGDSERLVTLLGELIGAKLAHTDAVDLSADQSATAVSWS
jgi:FlaA1/EpsC-like NDP-sugar epimerase